MDTERDPEEGPLPQLRHERIATTQCTGFACPEQHEGTLIDGRVFYYRLRFSRATLGVGATLDDAVQDGWTRPHAIYNVLSPLDGEPEGIMARIPDLHEVSRGRLLTGAFDDNDAARQIIFAQLLEGIQ